MTSLEDKNIIINDKKSNIDNQNKDLNKNSMIGAGKGKYYHKYVKYKMKYIGLRNAWSNKDNPK